MESSIHEPFLLQSYSNSRKFQKAKALVHATHASSSSSADGFVTVAAQGDGVHILDVSTLHPVISHTLGPSTTFSCPPVTHCAEEHTTYAAIASASELPANESNRVIWSWKDTTAASGSKQTVSLPHEIHSLSMQHPMLVVVSVNGSVTLLDADLTIQRTFASTSPDHSVTKTFCFSGKECSFATAGLACLVVVEASKKSNRVRALSISADRSIQDLGSCPLLSEVTDVSCNASGYLTVVTRGNELHSQQLRISSITCALELSTLSPPVRLAPLSSISLLALQSSFVLLSGLSQQKITLLIWDMRFSIVMASQTVDVPEGTGSNISLSLVASSKRSSSEAILVVSPSPTSPDSKSPARSSVFIVPVVVPTSSTIAAAMGRAAATASWLKAQKPAPSQFGSSQQKLLKDMRSAMEQSRPQSASQAFLAWEKQEKKTDGQVIFGQAFVKELLGIALQPTKPANFPYSSDIVRRLLEIGVVSASMLDTGYLSLLRMRNDWTSIRLSLTKVADLLEVEIIDCLRYVISREAPADAMQVDGASPDAPTLPEFLQLCVSYTCSPVALRSALKRCLPDAGDIARVMEVLDNWLGQWSGREVSLLPPKKALERSADGVFAVNTSYKGTDLPPMNNIITFLQAILDSSLMVLLQHPPAHRVLRRLTGRIESEIRAVDETEPLRGSLESFVKAQLKASEQGTEVLADWRQRSKVGHEQAAGAIGVYQVERLVL